MAGKARELELNKLLIGDTGDIAARRIDLEQRVGHRATVIQAITEYVEIMPKGVSKGAGLLWLLERLEIEPAAVLAMGDGENDIEMLQLAGIGVTMSNARPPVQAAADYIVGSNDESAVAQALERFVLG